MPNNIMLSNPVNGYSIFKTNQLLTADHLNSIGQFFDYHDRLTRARLLGVGIVCGLHTAFTQRTVFVSRGVGVTSDGDLLNLETDQSFTGLAPYDDKDAKYDLFQSLGANTDKKNLWMLTSNEEEDGYTPVASFFDANNPASNYVIILYTSQYIKNTDNCSGEDCDGKADRYTQELRVLLLSKTDFDRITKNQKGCDQNYFTLPELAIPRVLLNEQDSVFSYGDFVGAYNSAITNGVAQLKTPLELAANAADLLQQSYLANGGLAPVFSEKELKGVAGMGDMVKKALTNKQQGIQYVYDFVKDIAAAYQEFKESVFDLCAGCCISPDAFPKHLALGLLQKTDLVGSYGYRNHFVAAPILDKKEHAIEAALQLFSRLSKMIAGFGVPLNGAIKITPSVSVQESLDKKSIPFYYKTDELVAHWSPTNFNRNRSQTNLSYHAETYSSLPHIVQPLAYDLDKYSFFRIEGHVGKSYDEAYTTIDNLRKQYDLPFDLVAVQLQKERLTFIPPKFLKPGLLDLLFDKERLQLNTKLDFAKKYNESLVQNLPDDADLSQQAVTKEYGDATVLKKLVLTKKLELDQHIDTAQQALFKPVVEVAGKVSWDKMHTNMANVGAQINKNAKLLTSAAYRSPLENLAVLEQPQILIWLGDLLQRQKEKVQDGFIFSNFLKQNPSLMHHAGVCTGGTFVLVYETLNGNRTVVGDFYLPYIAKDELVDSKVDQTVVKPPPIKDFDFSIVKDIIKRPLLNTDLFDLKNKMITVEKISVDSDILVRQRLTDYEGRINKVGQEVLTNGQNIIREVGAVKDKYESSFSKLIASYDTVVTKNNRITTGDLGDIKKKDLDDLVDGVRTEFNGRFFDLESVFDKKITAVNTDLATTKNQLVKAANDILNVDKKVIGNRTELLDKAVADNKSITDRVNAVEAGFNSKLAQAAAGTDTKINAAVNGLNVSIANSMKTVDQKIASTRTEVLQAADRSTIEKINAQKLVIDSSINKLNTDLSNIKIRIR